MLGWPLKYIITIIFEFELKEKLERAIREECREKERQRRVARKLKETDQQHVIPEVSKQLEDRLLLMHLLEWERYECVSEGEGRELAWSCEKLNLVVGNGCTHPFKRKWRKKCRWSSKAVVIARLAGTIPRSTLKAGRRLDGARKRKRLDIAMVQKKALLERLAAKSTRLDVAARKKEIYILNYRFRKLNIGNEYVKKAPESPQSAQESESLDNVEQEVEATGYMLGGISLGKVLSACDQIPACDGDLDIVNVVKTNNNQQEVSTMVQNYWCTQDA